MKCSKIQYFKALKSLLNHEMKHANEKLTKTVFCFISLKLKILEVLRSGPCSNCMCLNWALSMNEKRVKYLVIGANKVHFDFHTNILIWRRFSSIQVPLKTCNFYKSVTQEIRGFRCVVIRIMIDLCVSTEVFSAVGRDTLQCSETN